MLDIQKRLSNTFYAILAMPATAMGFGLVVQIAALSWLLSTKYGLNLSEIGLVWATGPLAGIIGQVLIGIISDKVWVWNGRRKVFIWVGGVIAALGLLALPNIDILKNVLGLEGILGLAIIVSLSIDLAINVGFNPTRSIIADVTPEGRPRTKGFTWMQTVSGTFGVLGYLIGAVFDNYVLLYFGVFLVFAFSILPPFFIKEPRYLGQYGREDELPGTGSGEEGKPKIGKVSFGSIMMTILPLWGFLIYALYSMIIKIFALPRIPHYGLEVFCAILTLVMVIYTLAQKESGISAERDGFLGFRKVLAAHSFTWIGVQAMFIYFFAFVRQRIPELAAGDFDPEFLEAFLGSSTGATGFEIINNKIGSITNWSFLSLNLVAAIIPVLILEPVAARFGRVHTHAACLAFLSLGYLGIFYLGYSPTLIYTFMAIAGIGWAATITLPFAIMSQKIPQAQMGLYMGLFNLSVVLPQFVASFGVGEFLDQVENKDVLFIVCAISLGISVLAWLMIKEPVDSLTANPVQED